jgi:hypothetical protein
MHKKGLQAAACATLTAALAPAVHSLLGHDAWVSRAGSRSGGNEAADGGRCYTDAVPRRQLTNWAQGIALWVIAALMATQPLGVLAHLLHSHLEGHAESAHHDVRAHSTDDHDPDHDADHAHPWMSLAAMVVVPVVGEPQFIAALRVAEDLQQPSPASPPPFSPPRA